MEIYILTKTEEKTSKTEITLHESEVEVGGNMIVNAEEKVEIAGSDVNVEGLAAINANELIVRSMEEVTTETYEKSEMKITGSESKYADNSYDVSITGEISEYSRESTSVKNISSNFSSGHLLLNIEEDIEIAGSSVSVLENAEVRSGGDFRLVDVKDVEEEIEKTKEVELEVGVSIGNSYVDTYNAGKGVNEARQAVHQAKEKLDRMEKLYEEGKASERAVELAKTELGLAVEGLIAATTSLALSTAGSASAVPSLGTGFYGEAYADMRVSESESSIRQESSVGSSFIVGGDTVMEIGGDVKIETVQNESESIGSSFGINLGGNGDKDSTEYVSSVGANASINESYTKTTSEESGIVSRDNYDDTKTYEENVITLLESEDVNIEGESILSIVKEDIEFINADFSGNTNISTDWLTKEGRDRILDAYENFYSNTRIPYSAIGALVGWTGFISDRILERLKVKGYGDATVDNNQDGVVEFKNNPLMSDETGLALGDIINYGIYDPNDPFISTYTLMLIDLQAHEMVHVDQAREDEILYLPKYFANGGISSNNPYEIEADCISVTNDPSNNSLITKYC